MAKLAKISRLKKNLNLIDVFSIATGATLSAGFFLLPGIAASQAGPAIVLAYLLAAIPLIPAMFSMIELSTAMPRAGGVYYFLDRTLGPLFGTIGGLGTWLALILKVSFALIGMGAYIALFFPELQITPIAIALAVILGIINYFGAKKSGSLQVYLLVGLLSILALFIGGGVPNVNLQHFQNFFGSGFDSILSTAGLVYISYVGITKVASLSEEVKNPERNLPIGVILSFSVSLLVYILGTTVMVGVVPMEVLAGNLTPVATAADYILGRYGVILLSIAALLAFVSVANAGTLSASRYPLAMSRDHIIPSFFNKLSIKGTPVYALLLTVFIIVVILIFLDPMGIAKLASAFQLLMFALVCLAVIVMRESKIDSYDPGYKSPLYPWTQIIGIFAPLFLIIKMGLLPMIFSSGLIIVGVLWYYYYAKEKISRTGAIFHIFERLGRSRYEGLDVELRGILKEKGLRKDDQFDEIVMHSYVIDLKRPAEFSEVAGMASEHISNFVNHTAEEIKLEFLEGTKIGATPVTHGVALPHLRIDGLDKSVMVLVRSIKGVHITFNNPLTDNETEEEETVTAIFFLVSAKDNPTQHLRILAQIAGRVDEESFTVDWKAASDEHELKEALLHDERWLSISLRRGDSTESIIGTALKDISFPSGSLVALIKREGISIIPKGSTILKEGDKLTIIGDPVAIKEIEKIFIGINEVKGI